MNRLLQWLLVAGLLFAAGAAQARLEITVSGGTEGALPIAVVPFDWEGPQPLAEDVAAIIRANLLRSGRFAPLEVNALPARPVSVDAVNYRQWRGAGVDNLVIGRVRLAHGGGYQVEFRLLDAVKGEQQAGYALRASAAQLRSAAHRISDLIYEQLTGEPGAFNTRIAYITQRDEAGQRLHRLSVADADGHNERVILTSGQPLMSPVWAPDGQRLAYVSFEEGGSAVYVQHVATGQRERVAAYPGINSAPAWSPDGRRLALTLSKEGYPDIYLLDLASGTLTRVTRSHSIDTEPSWLPDGRGLIFTSDRGGRPQLYRIALADGRPQGTARRLTFEGAYNARPVVSPDGRLVAMVHGRQGAFHIAVQDLETGTLRLLTSGRQDESPSFSPNGRLIIYATRAGERGVLQVVPVDGQGQQRLGLADGSVREPAWSPFSQ